jgi:hypothetical protein
MNDPTRATDTPAGLDPLEACTLPADDMATRMVWIREAILPHAVARETIAGGVALELRDAPGLAAKLDRLVELERDCCSGIAFGHQPSSVAGQRRLEVRGLDPSAPILEATLRSAPEKQGVAGRLGRAAGIGTLIGLFVCCVLPAGAAALLGAKAADPLAALDQPWVIAGSGLLFGATAFGWQSRQVIRAFGRRTRRPGGRRCSEAHRSRRPAWFP